MVLAAFESELLMIPVLLLLDQALHVLFAIHLICIIEVRYIFLGRISRHSFRLFSQV